MRCAQCGNELREGARFCNNCGLDVQTSIAVNATATANANVTSTATAPPTPTKPKMSNRNKGLLASVGSALAVALVAVLVVSFATRANADVRVDEENFPDDVFRAYVSDNVDTNGDNKLSPEEIDNVTTIDVSNYARDGAKVNDLTGIGHFRGLRTLNASHCNLHRMPPDFHECHELRVCDVSYNYISETINVTENRDLIVLYVGGNQEGTTVTASQETNVIVEPDRTMDNDDFIDQYVGPGDTTVQPEDIAPIEVIGGDEGSDNTSSDDLDPVDGEDVEDETDSDDNTLGVDYPDDQEDPENPGDPSVPDDTVEQIDPENTDSPEEPVDPENPEEATDPSNPENPEEAANPENPEEPQDPESTDSPDNPDGTTEPNPGEEPATPEQSEPAQEPASLPAYTATEQSAEYLYRARGFQDNGESSFEWVVGDQIPDGSVVGTLQRDFDGDGEQEQLVVLWRGGNIDLQMFEGGSDASTPSATLSDRSPSPIKIQGDFSCDVACSEDGAIYLQWWYTGNPIVTGVVWTVERVDYRDGQFSMSEPAKIEGSGTLDLTGLRSQMQALGLSATYVPDQSYDDFTQSNLADLDNSLTLVTRASAQVDPEVVSTVNDEMQNGTDEWGELKHLGSFNIRPGNAG